MKAICHWLTIGVLVGWVSAAQAEQQWFLMTRHGDCADVASLKRKVPDLGAVRDPESFVKLMREKGHQVQTSEMDNPNGKIVDVRVPERELALMFVPAALCERTPSR